MKTHSQIPKLLGFGLLAAAFFSSTFIVNRALSLAGGHWVWTASLRYGWMIFFLVAWLLLSSGKESIMAVARVFTTYWRFWIFAGTIGFGLFYAPLAYAAKFTPGWVVASTWQVTILATFLVLMIFGKNAPKRSVMLSFIIFAGILLVNLTQAATESWQSILPGIASIIVAAFAYPTGNQLVWETQHGKNRYIPSITDEIMAKAPARVLLLTLGSIPFWLVLVLLIHPPAPSGGQLINTGIVALSSGVIATSIFFSARQKAQQPNEIAAVDATQSGETVFTLFGEMLLLGLGLPTLLGWAGLFFIVAGLVAYSVKKAIPIPPPEPRLYRVRQRSATYSSGH